MPSEGLAESLEQGFLLGVALGVFVGNVFMMNVGLGIALGVGVSPLLGLAWHWLMERLVPK